MQREQPSPENSGPHSRLMTKDELPARRDWRQDSRCSVEVRLAIEWTYRRGVVSRRAEREDEADTNAVKLSFLVFGTISLLSSLTIVMRISK